MTPEEFDAWYGQRFGPLTGQLFALCGSRSEARDAVQEAFLRAWTKRSTLAQVADRDAWIRTVARRIIVSTWRSRRREVHVDPPETFEGPDAASRLALHRALASLPTQQRHAVVLHHLLDLPVAEVAREMGAGEGTVHVWLTRGRRRLHTLLTDLEETSHA